MKTFDINIKRYFKDGGNFQIKGNRNKLLYDTEKQNYFITNGYSFIRLNNNNTKEKNKIDFLKNNYGIDTDYLAKTISNYNRMNSEKNFCNYIDIEKAEIKKNIFGRKYYKVSNEISFDYKMLNHIKKVLGGEKFGYFTSVKDNTFVCITSKNGYAYLLAKIKID